MGEARRRASQGLPPRQKKIDPKDSERFLAWLPLTRSQASQFVSITTRGAWVGIGALVVFWVVVRFVGPTAGWWTLADTP
ncbi:MAG: DUF2839 domain-containing protein [Synechococcus sp.]|uniref:DUF2839 domain-containing protein n=1 Tax=Synechococcus sp. BMK-MC-1 TaxID=1442551 RepID=UPI0016484ED8|nr:DUF2839 domain-containing protein [Synechococcus sp. BMK-MC-1]QNI66665.1 uncharacterized conserved membrane protein (DUF2839) [Synechococcus sp. BMK-MC-1]